MKYFQSSSPPKYNKGANFIINSSGKVFRYDATTGIPFQLTHLHLTNADFGGGMNMHANDNGIVSKAELNKLTKVQLFDLAEKQSLKVKKSGTKAAVVSEIWSQLRQK